MKFIKQGNYYTTIGNNLLTHKRRPGKRGKIKSFSKASRKRLLRYFARLKWQGALFVTLTARDDFDYAHVIAWIKRYWRRWRKVPVLWRKEYQRRGVVHYHLLIFTRSWLPLKWIKRTWSEIIGDETSVDVKYAENRSKVGYYLSKYMAKLPRLTEVHGFILNLDIINNKPPAPSVSEAQCGDGVLDISNIICHDTIGRVWGILGREGLRYYKIVAVTATEAVMKVYEAVREWLVKQNIAYVTRFGFIVWADT